MTAALRGQAMLAGRALKIRWSAAHSKAAGMKTDGFALSPYDVALGANIVWGCRTGAAKVHERPGLTTQVYACARSLSAPFYSAKSQSD